MSTIIWSGIAVGFIGSLHCLGMCGPIALALPSGNSSKGRLFLSRLIYNLGRIVTYAALGAVSGMLGKTVEMAGLQQSVSIGVGVLIIVGVFLPSRIAAKFLPTGVVSRLLGGIKLFWQGLLFRQTLKSLFMLGLLNGLLPCGFLYLALVTAATTGSIIQAILFMALFGVGTAPVLMATSFAGSLLTIPARRKLMRFAPVGATVLAIVLILRGLSLGIPYLSPNVHHTHTTTVNHSCCE